MKLFAKDRPLTPSWDLLAPSVELLRKNALSVAYLSLVPGIFVTAGLAMTHALQNVADFDPSNTAGVIVLILASVWTLLAYPGYILMAAEAAEGKR